MDKVCLIKSFFEDLTKWNMSDVQTATPLCSLATTTIAANAACFTPTTTAGLATTTTSARAHHFCDEGLEINELCDNGNISQVATIQLQIKIALAYI